MRFITYSLLLVYAIPVFVIGYAGISSHGFEARSGAIYIASAISSTFFMMLRDMFGSMIVPLVTAYSIPQRTPEAKVPRETVVMFACLIGFFVMVTALYGFVKFRERELEVFNTGTVDVAKVFQDTILMYVKETLAYIALVLGISLKK